ncbi:hypothetical protein RGV33_03640 [Pseudomonas sp. Bout1]|uniref:hypothetical protein n=1 Tax=Pseudomonas sp. Bout1 TaxID=3048600 RepID=UPI002AB43219|nr:hypothetical protein [Pseudomonas sp. Bout1]MDY7530777.1 hypothetical protein [Pseudomonas sp. Bout1]MEB0184608.1 hypothetical protein [Pseudomonas sp. Bout1]
MKANFVVWLALVHAGRDVLQEKSEGPFGGVFPGNRNNKTRIRRVLVVLRIWWSRGNLNPLSKLLIYSVNIDHYFWLEYQLEYCTSVDYPFAFDLARTFWNRVW